MESLTITKKEQEKLRGFDVCTVYLFGSRAEGIPTELSDYDFGILLNDSLRVKPGHDTTELYQKLFDFLSPLCPRTAKNDVIDIVFLQSGVSLELQANVVSHGKIIFDENPELRAKYEEQVMIRMADIKPILDIMDRAILARI